MILEIFSNLNDSMIPTREANWENSRTEIGNKLLLAINMLCHILYTSIHFF